MVSVIICFYERTQHLFRCLDSLEFNRDYFDEVVISDDGSSEETRILVESKIKEYSFKIFFITRESKGFEVAATRNNGIRYASGKYLIFIDCDLTILPNTLAIHVKNARKRKFVIGHCKYLDQQNSKCILENHLNSPQEIIDLYASISDKPLIKLEKRQRKLNLFFSLRLHSFRKQSLGGHFSIHKEDILKVNGYDENYKGWGAEDADLGRRLVKSGCRAIAKQSSAKVLHLWHQREHSSENWKNGKNINYFERKKINSYCKNGLEK